MNVNVKIIFYYILLEYETVRFHDTGLYHEKPASDLAQDIVIRPAINAVLMYFPAIFR